MSYMNDGKREGREAEVTESWGSDGRGIPSGSEVIARDPESLVLDGRVPNV